MKKLLVSLGLLLLSLSSVSALSCVDLKSNLTKGKENAEVLVLQNFLVSKGFLTAKPNGYFGNGTVLAVKKYQKSVGLSRSGGVLPLTRGVIKKETCLNQATPSDKASTNASSSSAGITTPVSYLPPNGCTSLTGFNVLTGVSCSVTTNFPEGCSSFDGFSTTTGLRCVKSTNVGNTAPVAVASSTTVIPILTVSPKLPLTLNEKRQEDLNTLLGAMYAFYRDSNGTFPIPAITLTPVEICTLGISLCKDLHEVKSSLVPKFLAKIPTDPSLASSTGSGYFITRLGDGTITLTAPKADSKATILATCNFSSKCKITTATDALLLQEGLLPRIDSIDKATFISGGIMSAPLVIHGKGFSTSTNIVNLSQRGVRKIYTLGTFPSVDGVTITASSTFTNTALPCGVNCLEIPGLGEYDLTVTTKIGESNPGYISLKSITTRSVPNSPDASFIPKSTHVKLATITISSSVLVDIKSLKINASSSPIFRASTTSAVLPTLATKISNFTLTDVLADKIINGGPAFTFTNQSITDNQSKIYELYADIADIDILQAGQVNFSGEFVVKDYVGTGTITIPIPKFLITVSY